MASLATSELHDPERSYTAQSLRDYRSTASYDLSTLASLARVNRALWRMPWPAAACMAHLVLDQSTRTERERLANSIKGRSPAAVAARTAIKAKLEEGLAVVGRACDALLRGDLAADGADAADVARAPGSAAERAYRACVRFLAVDVLWRPVHGPEAHGYTVICEPPARLVDELRAVGLSRRLPAELRAAALSTLGAVLLRRALVADPKLACLDAGLGQQPALPAPQLKRLGLASAELRSSVAALGDAVDAIDSRAAWWIGPAGLEIMALLDDRVCESLILLGSKRVLRDERWRWSPPASALLLLMAKACAPLCALFADTDAPVGARACAAAALASLASHLSSAFSDDAFNDEASSGFVETAKSLLAALEESGATALYQALDADWQVRVGPALVMPVSRSHLLNAARRLVSEVDDNELRATVEDFREMESGSD